MGFTRRVRKNDVLEIDGPATIFVLQGRSRLEIKAKPTVKITPRKEIRGQRGLTIRRPLG